MSNPIDIFQSVLHLVKLGMAQRFGRDPIVVDAYELKIKIEHPSEAGTFLSWDFTPTGLAQRGTVDLANALLDDYADVEKKTNVLAYARQKFPGASVRLLDDDFDREVVGIVELKFRGAPVRAGFTRPLWDHTANWKELHVQMERYGWRNKVNSSSNQKALLGDDGWVEWE